MSLNQKKSTQDIAASPLDLSPETIQSFIETQKLKTLNEAKELDIRLKEMELNAKLAERSMDYQNEYLKRKPSENRKSLTRICYILCGISGIFFLFMLALLYLGHKDFAYQFLKGLSYVVVSGLSFIAGRKRTNFTKSKDNEQDNIADAEIVDASR